jgi:antirestriction protein ArdC
VIDEDRYKAVLVEGGQRFYYETLMDYIHLNPALAMRSAANVSQLLRRTARERINPKLPKRLVAFVKRAMRESIESRFAH